MKLGILAIHINSQESAEHKNLLGASMHGVYRHLFDEAGVASRPVTVKRGVTYIETDAYSVPTAPASLRVSEMATMAVDRLLVPAEVSAEKVSTVMHAQCTIDQQILSSTCLRIQHDHFPNARLSMNVGQAGTAGVGTAFELARHRFLKDGADGLICISAADKWIAPYIRRYPGLVSFADTAAACLLSTGQNDGYVADVLATAAISRPLPFDFTLASHDERIGLVVDAAVNAIRGVLLADGNEGDASIDSLIDGVIGDAYEPEVISRIGAEIGLPEHMVFSATTNGHASSAAPLAAIAKGVALAHQLRKTMHFIIWTASISGHGSAMLIRCHPGATCISDTWLYK